MKGKCLLTNCFRIVKKEISGIRLMTFHLLIRNPHDSDISNMSDGEVVHTIYERIIWEILSTRNRTRTDGPTRRRALVSMIRFVPDTITSHDQFLLRLTPHSNLNK